MLTPEMEKVWNESNKKKYPPRLLEIAREIAIARGPRSEEETNSLTQRAASFSNSVTVFTADSIDAYEILREAEKRFELIREEEEKEERRRRKEQQDRESERYAAERREEKLRREIQDRKDRIAAEDEILGPRYRTCDFDNWVFHEVPKGDCGIDAKIRRYQEDAVEAVREYARDITQNVAEGRNLILYGPVGTGKDFLMASVAKSVSRNIEPEIAGGYAGLLGDKKDLMAVCVGANLFASLRDSMGDGKESEAKILRRFVDPCVLLLSDPLLPGGAELTPYQRGQLFHIINDRSVKMRPTIVTINVSSTTEMQSKLSPQIADRLLDGALVVHCNWPSFRKPQKVVSSSRQK